MKSLLFFFLSSASLLCAGGFTIPEHALYTKLEARFLGMDRSFDNRGNRISQPEINLLEDGIEHQVLNLFAGWGFHERVSVTANIQFLDATLDNRFAADSTRSGISDIWLQAQWLVWKSRVHWVLNSGIKLPQEDNIPRSPQISNGEQAFDLSLGLGFGASAYYLEAELGHIWNDGFVNNVRDGGLPYEDEWFLILKAGWHLGQKWVLEGWARNRQTRADLAGQSFIAGIYTNSDELLAQASLSYELTPRWQLGVQATQTLDGKNVLLTQGYGIHLAYRWDRP